MLNAYTHIPTTTPTCTSVSVSIPQIAIWGSVCYPDDAFSVLTPEGGGIIKRRMIRGAELNKQKKIMVRGREGGIEIMGSQLG